MKKISVFLTIVLLLFFGANAYATWTITASIDKEGKIKDHRMQYEYMYRVKLECTSDASGTDYALLGDIMGKIKNSFLYLIKTVPGTGGDAPTGTFDLDIEDDNNDHLLDTDANPNDSNKFTVGHATLGVYPIIFDHVSVVIATLGDANKATIYLYFAK
ncbi:MAG: hypothetical protein ACYSR9_06660 [Planctomycetota bacterium]|jgi:hypothetical protein